MNDSELFEKIKAATAALVEAMNAATGVGLNIEVSLRQDDSGRWVSVVVGRRIVEYWYRSGKEGV